MDLDADTLRALRAVAPTAAVAARARGLDLDRLERILRVAAPRTAADIDASPDDLGPIYEAALLEQTRKSGGIYYSRRQLVEPTVARTLAPLLDGRAEDTLAICDPAAGGGAFLLAAHRQLVAAGIERTRALSSLAGVDIDRGAVLVARTALWLEAADPGVEPNALDRVVRHGDARFGDWQSAGDRADRDARCAVALGRPIGARRPFHWPLEFADIMQRGGFDAIVGNPPWEIDKPDSRRFFAAVDPGFRSQTKQDALQRQRALCDADPDLTARWEREIDDTKAIIAWIHGPRSPFTRQGRGDANLYKHFVELAWRLLRPGGRLGMLLPSGIYTDAGAADLRAALLDEGQWEWLFGFENRRKLFAIDNRFKFACVIAQKGGVTTCIRTAFMRQDPADWSAAAPATIDLGRDVIGTLSPRSRAIPELRSPRDAAILDRIHAHARPFAAEFDEGMTMRRELDLTNDSHLFPPRDDWARRGYVSDDYGRWVRSSPGRQDDVALPLYEGRMIGAYDFSEKGWVRGRGRRAEWRTIPFTDRAKPIEPQYLFPARDLAAVDPQHHRPKIGFMAIGSATNRRTMVATSLFGAPCGNSVPTLRGRSTVDDLCILAVINSFVFDYALRLRLGGVNLNRFVLAETPMLAPDRRRAIAADVVIHVAALSWPAPRFAPAWLALGVESSPFALDAAERRHRRAWIDAVVARAYGVSRDDLGWILAGCGHPVQDLGRTAFTRALDPKGFWREDRSLPPAERLPALTIRYFESGEAPTVASPTIDARTLRAHAKFLDPSLAFEAPS